MKKLLLATSALIATAAAASAADVKLGGDAWMGVVYKKDGYQDNLNTENTTDDWQFKSRIRIRFDVTGETDSGLAYGGSARADNATGAASKGGDNGNQMTDGEVYVSSEFGKLEMGDVSGGFETVVGDLPYVGYEELQDFNETIYFFDYGADLPTALYSYTFSDVTVGVGADDDGEYSLGLGYDNGTFSAGVGYEHVPAGNGVGFSLGDNDSSISLGEAGNGSISHWGGSLGVKFAGVSLKALYTKAQDDVHELNQYGVGAEYTVQAWTFAGYWKRVDTSPTVYIADSDGNPTSKKLDGDIYGIGAYYDLGGGAKLAAGYMNADGTNYGDFGMVFKF